MKTKRYETLMVLHPELPEAQTRETIDRARRLVTEMSGEVHQIQEWGIRELAYSIRKVGRGYYVLVEYTASADVVRELERTMKIADEILRFVSVVCPTLTRKQRAAKPRTGKPPAAAAPDFEEIAAPE
jgi:small subunit ribosomal protein S6